MAIASYLMVNTARFTVSNTNQLTNVDIEVCRVTAPLEAEVACDVESLLLKILEYGNYSFHLVLLGEYSRTLPSAVQAFQFVAQDYPDSV